MSSSSGEEFAHLLTRAPAGVALLGRVEVTRREDLRWFDWPPDSEAHAVHRAAESVATMNFGDLLELAVSAADRFAGPWSGEALAALPALYAATDRRREIAEAITDTFYDQLHLGADPRAQQWWYEEPRDPASTPRPRFVDYDDVYGNGEFTRAGLWTVTDPPASVHDAITVAWDVGAGALSRWLMPVRDDARIWTIDAPEDWSRLVEAYPKLARRAHAGWELPGPNQHRSDTKALRQLPHQHALRDEVTSHVVPDWGALAADIDGVHLSWAGFLTSEGYVSDLGRGGVTMLRYWGSERTLWLNDVFDEPRPLTAPALTSRVSGSVVDVTVDRARRASDGSTLAALLGRRGSSIS